MGRKEELLNDTVDAYVEATGDVPDTRDYVAVENVVQNYMDSEGKEEK